MVKVHKTFLSAKPEIDQAIVAAEKGTTGELVVVFTQRAGDYGRIEAVLAFGVALATLAVTGLWLSTGWTSRPGMQMSLGVACLELVGGFALGLGLARMFPRLGVILTPKQIVATEVEKSAALAYRNFNVTETKADTGVLIFISELERRVVVMGDQAIAAKVGDREWETIRDLIIAGIHDGNPVKGLIEGIGHGGDLLRRHFPSSSDTEDELPSELHIT